MTDPFFYCGFRATKRKYGSCTLFGSRGKQVWNVGTWKKYSRINVNGCAEERNKCKSVTESRISEWVDMRETKREIVRSNKREKEVVVWNIIIGIEVEDDNK